MHIPLNLLQAVDYLYYVAGLTSRSAKYECALGRLRLEDQVSIELNDHSSVSNTNLVIKQGVRHSEALGSVPRLILLLTASSDGGGRGFCKDGAWRSLATLGCITLNRPRTPASSEAIQDRWATFFGDDRR